MALKFVKTRDAFEIHHSEHKVSKILAIAGAIACVFMAYSGWHLLAGNASSLSDIAPNSLIELIGFELTAIIAIPAIIYNAGYLTCPLIVMSNGSLLRNFYGIRIASTIGHPMSLELIENKTAQKRLKKLKRFDLYISGPQGSHLVTTGGKIENYFAIAKSSNLPIGYK